MNIDYGQASQLNFLDEDDVNETKNNFSQSNFDLNGFESQNQFASQYSKEDLVIFYSFI